MRPIWTAFLVAAACALGFAAGARNVSVPRATAASPSHMLVAQVQDMRVGEAQTATELARVEGLFLERITRLEKVAAVQAARIDALEAQSKVATNAAPPPPAIAPAPAPKPQAEHHHHRHRYHYHHYRHRHKAE